MRDDLYTVVTVDDKEYTIQKFTARTGLKLARLILSKAAPLLPMLAAGDGETEGEKKSPSKAAKNAKQRVSENDSGFIYKAVSAVLDSLSDEDMDELIDKCLRVCYVRLPAGLQPIIDETGHYGVEGIEYDMPLTIRLCFEAIKWGAGDFFKDKGLDLSRLLK